MAAWRSSSMQLVDLEYSLRNGKGWEGWGYGFGMKKGNGESRRCDDAVSCIDSQPAHTPWVRWVRGGGGEACHLSTQHSTTVLFWMPWVMDVTCTGEGGMVYARARRQVRGRERRAGGRCDGGRVMGAGAVTHQIEAHLVGVVPHAVAVLAQQVVQVAGTCGGAGGGGARVRGQGARKR